MALLFNVKVPTTSRHILNLNGGLNESTISKMEKVQIEGTKQPLIERFI